jgi:hypothetical protein
MDFPRLISTEGDPQQRQDIDALARRRQRPAWPYQGGGVRADAAQRGAGATVRAAGRPSRLQALRLVRRPPVQGWELATVTFRARTLDLVAHRRRSITLTSLVSHLSVARP